MLLFVLEPALFFGVREICLSFWRGLQRPGSLTLIILWGVGGEEGPCAAASRPCTPSAMLNSFCSCSQDLRLRGILPRLLRVTRPRASLAMAWGVAWVPRGEARLAWEGLRSARQPLLGLEPLLARLPRLPRQSTGAESPSFSLPESPSLRSLPWSSPGSGVRSPRPSASPTCATSTGMVGDTEPLRSSAASSEE